MIVSLAWKTSTMHTWEHEEARRSSRTCSAKPCLEFHARSPKQALLCALVFLKTLTANTPRGPHTTIPSSATMVILSDLVKRRSPHHPIHVDEASYEHHLRLKIWRTSRRTSHPSPPPRSSDLDHL